MRGRGLRGQAMRGQAGRCCPRRCRRARHNDRVTLPPEPANGSYQPWSPPPVPVGTGSASTAKRPSAAGYWIGAAIAVVGVVASIIWFVVTLTGVVGAADSYPRFSVPGSRSVELETGTYKIFVEYPGANLDLSQSPLVSGLSVIDPDGRDVAVTNSVINETYAWNGRDGRVIGQFTSSRAGRYTVSANSARESSSRVVDVAIGPGLDLSVVGPLLGSMALGAFAVLIALVIVIITVVRRGRWKRSRRPSMTVGGYRGPSGPVAYGASGPGDWGGYPGYSPGPSGPAGPSGPPSMPGPSVPLGAPPHGDFPSAPPAPWSPDPAPPAAPGSWGAPSGPPVSPPLSAPAHPPGWDSAPGVARPVAPPADPEDGSGTP